MTRVALREGTLVQVSSSEGNGEVAGETAREGAEGNGVCSVKDAERAAPFLPRDDERSEDLEGERKAAIPAWLGT